MIRDYWVHIPPHLFDVLQEIGGTTSEDFDTVISAARAAFFNFPYPVPASDKTDLENFILNRYILRRIGSGNVRKWRQVFKGKILEIMPYYNMLLESEHFTFDPLINNDLTTTDDEAGTLDYTHDKRTDNDYAYTKSGNENRTFEDDATLEADYEKSGGNTHNSETDGTTSGQYSKSGTTGKSVETDGTSSGTHSTTGSTTTDTATSGTEAGTNSKTGSETSATTEVNRYSDTPQGDSSRIWELDAQGHPVLTDIFLTDIRGITTNGTRQYTESGNDSKTTSGTVDTDGTSQESGTESGTTHSETEESGTWTETGTESGTSHSETEESGTWTEQGTSGEVTHDENETNTTYAETGSDQRDIVEHETHDQDTTRSNENYKLGLAGVSRSQLLNEYRTTFLRIYTDIATELEPLFYNLVEIDDILDFV